MTTAIKLNYKSRSICCVFLGLGYSILVSQQNVECVKHDFQVICINSPVISLVKISCNMEAHLTLKSKPDTYLLVVSVVKS